MQAMRDGVAPESDVGQHNSRRPFVLRWMDQAIDALLGGLPRVGAELVRLRARTGLDRLVVPAKLDLPPTERVRQLIRQLRTDKDFAGLGRLAVDLMAAVQIPRAVSTPDDLPVGGVSDIANRGPLDRLLVSELAHDDAYRRRPPARRR